MSSLRHLVLKTPTLNDGMAVHRLIKHCPPLDTNSSYCNLLQCSHFANTSVAAELEGQLAGFISGYIIPERLDTLFIWQVAVADSARGLGLATRMLLHILNRSQCHAVNFLETSITQSNQASWALFSSLANKLSVNLESSPWMLNDEHFAGQHDSEALVRIGAFNPHDLDKLRGKYENI